PQIVAMKSLLVLVLLAILACGVYLVLQPGGAPPAGGAGGVAVPGQSEQEDTNSQASDRAELSLPDEVDTGMLSGANGSGSRIAADDSGVHSSFEVDSDRMLSVQIQLPEGHPGGEELEVWAFFDIDASPQIAEMVTLGERAPKIAKEVQASNWSRSSVVAGKAAVPVPPSGSSAVLLPVGRFLQPLQGGISLNAEVMGQVQHLAPELGACAEITILLPDDAAGSDRSPGMLLLSVANAVESELGHLRSTGHMLHRNWGHPRADFTQTLRGIDAEGQSGVNVYSEPFLDHTGEILALVAGVASAHVMTLEWGGQLTVRVTDEEGAVLPGASVNAFEQQTALRTRSQQSRPFFGHTEADGTSVLRGLSEGTLSVHVDGQGFVGAVEEVEIEKDAQKTIDVVVQAGLTIAGTVRWFDGLPVEGATVMIPLTITEDLGSNGSSTSMSSRSAVTDSDGAFALSGVDERAVVGLMYAETRVQDEALSSKLGIERGTLCVGTAQPESALQKVELILEPSLTLAGVVSEENGDALAQGFSVSAWPAGGEQWGSHNLSGHYGSVSRLGSRIVVAGVESTSSSNASVSNTEAVVDGVFRLEGFSRGNWMIQAESDGYREMDPILIEMPLVGNLDIVMEKAGELTGVIEDPDGNPVAGARAVLLETNGIGSYPDESSEVTDSDGVFSVSVMEAEAVVQAWHPDWASSEKLSLSMDLLDPNEPLTLRLRQGATIRGIVFQEDGTPWPGRQVVVSDGPAMMAMVGPMGGPEPAITDADGRFELTRQTPGRLTVSAAPSLEEMEKREAAAREAGNDEQFFFELMGEVLSTRVEVADGETVEVVLGAEEKDPVTIQGTVSRGGAGVACQVMVLADDGPPMMGARGARSGADGRFELELDRPGTYAFLVIDSEFSNSPVTFGITVPDVDAYDIELPLSTGSVSGVVYGPDGEKLAGINLSLLPDDGANSILDLMVAGGGQRTSADGSFTFSAVSPGRYALRANAGLGPRTESVETAFGHMMLDGIAVGPDEEVDGLELRLPEGVSISGTIRDPEGIPMDGADIFLRDRNGRLLTTMTAGKSRSDGSYSIEGLSPGEVIVFARSDRGVSEDSPLINLGSSGAGQCDLVVKAGSFLVLTPVKDDKPVRIRATILDSNGRNWSGLWSMESLMSWMGEGSPIEEVRVGPLPPGRYSIEASTIDGSCFAKKTVTVRAGQEDRKVRLKMR
ncbi:MAG: hypothetical protein ACI9K5_003010, partial [Gammaproteobacteria bacterium]